MAASLPSLLSGPFPAAWRSMLEDWWRRLGRGKDISIDADATGYTITYREPDGTVHTKTTTW
jgi:hypothetical protein